jgi:hypothetical protein
MGSLRWAGWHRDCGEEQTGQEVMTQPRVGSRAGCSCRSVHSFNTWRDRQKGDDLGQENRSIAALLAAPRRGGAHLVSPCVPARRLGLHENGLGRSCDHPARAVHLCPHRKRLHLGGSPDGRVHRTHLLGPAVVPVGCDVKRALQKTVGEAEEPRPGLEGRAGRHPGEGWPEAAAPEPNSSAGNSGSRSPATDRSARSPD